MIRSRLPCTTRVQLRGTMKDLAALSKPMLPRTREEFDQRNAALSNNQLPALAEVPLKGFKATHMARRRSAFYFDGGEFIATFDHIANAARARLVSSGGDHATA